MRFVTPSRGVIVWLFSVLALAACDEAPLEPELAACGEVTGYIIPTEIVRPFEQSTWLNFVLVNRSERIVTVEAVTMKLAGEATIHNILLFNATTAISPVITTLNVRTNEKAGTGPLKLVLAPIVPFGIEPGGAVAIQLRAILAGDSWTSGFIIEVEKVELGGSCTALGFPASYTVPLGPSLPKG
ncbi:MAG: hypothetical protein HY378_01300 [Candidatus Brennerbacteria bacterium]|nr:hypothetical protein [Candidatus Brennerbacteria bacterium]